MYQKNFVFESIPSNFFLSKDYRDLPNISKCIEDDDIPTVSPEMDNNSMHSFSKKEYYKEDLNGWWKPESKDIDEFKKAGLISASVSEYETSSSEISIGIVPEKTENPLMIMRKQILRNKI